MTLTIPALDAADLRTLRYDSRRWLWSRAKTMRVRSCGRAAVGQSVQVLRHADGTVVGAGLQHCSSVWACPVCSARILQVRSERLTSILDAWRGRGGEVAMITLTMSHDRSDGLGELWESVQDAWSAVMSGPAWRAAQDRFGVVLDPGRTLAGPDFEAMRALRRAVDETDDGTVKSERLERAIVELGEVEWERMPGRRRIPLVRVVEVTWGPSHGWHVHVHALLLVRGGGDTETMLADLWLGDETTGRRGILGRWQHQAERRGRVADVLGQDAHVVRGSSAEAVGSYLAKAVLDGDISKELTRGDLKLAHGQHFTPWQILGVLASGSHPEKEAIFAALWAEWEVAARGRRQMVVSRGLAEWLGVSTISGDDDDDFAAGDAAAVGWTPTGTPDRLPDIMSSCPGFCP